MEKNPKHLPIECLQGPITINSVCLKVCLEICLVVCSGGLLWRFALEVCCGGLIWRFALKVCPREVYPICPRISALRGLPPCGASAFLNSDNKLGSTYEAAWQNVVIGSLRCMRPHTASETLFFPSIFSPFFFPYSPSTLQLESQISI